MNDFLVVDAKYKKTGASRIDGNPLSEVVAYFAGFQKSFKSSLAYYPPVPGGKLRGATNAIRLTELGVLGDIVFPFVEYESAGTSLTTMFFETYYARNPLAKFDMQRRLALATSGAENLPFPTNWKMSASGHIIVAVSGMGKTTFVKAFLLKYPQVIKHRRFEGQAIVATQILYLYLKIPHDGTLKGFCLQFFKEIDRILGTAYHKQAMSLGNIVPMVLLMKKVAYTVSLGMLFIDDLQHLRNVLANNAEIVLNLFSQIIEDIGVSIVFLSTPAVLPVLEASVRNGRKLTSNGETMIPPMPKDSRDWAMFCETLWQYSFTKKVGKLNKDIRDAWHRACGGDTAFATLSFATAQRQAIGLTEVVDESLFDWVAQKKMAFLQPAIQAMGTGDPAKMSQYLDMTVLKKYRALRTGIGIKEETETKRYRSEFAEVEESHAAAIDASSAKKRSRPSSKTKVSTLSAPDLPLEDPLAFGD